MSNRVTVHIRNIAFGGDGVGEVCAQNDGTNELLGITAFVPYSVPGETVVASIHTKKDRYVKGDLVQLESTVPSRIPPVCRYYMTCGGCELQHLSYEAQLDAKREMIRGALAAGRLSQEVLSRLDPIEPSEPYGYRRRVSLHINSTGDIGFYRAASRSVVAIDHCEVSVDGINQTLPKVQEFGRAVAGKVSSLLLESDAKGVIAVLKSPYALGRSEQRVVLDAAKSVFSDAVLLCGEKEVGGFGRQILELPLNNIESLLLHLPAGYFSQVNWGINVKLIKTVLELSAVSRNEIVFDLYAGAGNFALPFARAGARVTAVESDKRLVAFGRQNTSRYRFEKTLNYVESSVEKFLREKNKIIPDVIVADPPRSGLGNLVGEFPRAKRFLLISCHLPSFVRDIKALLSAGYSVERIRPFDMFPQTSYSEIVALLTAG